MNVTDVFAWRCWCWLVAAGLLVTTLTRPASAAPSRQVAEADAAFAEGKRLAAAGDYEKACNAFEKSQALAPGTGTLLNLGDCYEHVGRTSRAWATFRAAAAAARAKKNQARATEALARAAALEPRLVRLRVVVSSDVEVPGLTVLRDGERLEGTLWGAAIPVDPGEHVVQVSAPRHASFERRLTVPETPGVIEVIVPPLQAVEPLPPSASASDGEVQRVLGWVLGGVGVAAIGVGVGLGVDALIKNQRSADAGCVDNLCPPEGLTLRDAALTEAHLSTGILTAGLVHAAAGLALWLTAPQGTQLEVATLPAGGALLRVRGRF